MNFYPLFLDAKDEFLGVEIFDKDFYDLILRYFFNLLVAIIIIYFNYYRHNKKSHYTFTFFVFNTIVFMLCYIMASVKLSMGFAFGLFAVFSILRYRTDPIPIKEMTYLFIVISIAVINAISLKKVSYVELLFINFVIVFLTNFIEAIWHKRQLKLMKVDYLGKENLHTNRHKYLMQDLQKQTGLDIQWFEITSCNLNKGTATIKLFYKEHN